MTDRILRVAAMRNNRMIFDQTFARVAPVTIGRDSECTVILSGHAPTRHELFVASGGRYSLRLIGVMEARIKRATGLQQFADCAVIPLLPTDRGVIYLGEPGTRILFEFVAPPPRRRPLDILRHTLGFRKP